MEEKFEKKQTQNLPIIQFFYINVWLGVKIPGNKCKIYMIYLKN